jgi:hypothetical protein
VFDTSDWCFGIDGVYGSSGPVDVWINGHRRGAKEGQWRSPRYWRIPQKIEPLAVLSINLC